MGLPSKKKLTNSLRKQQHELLTHTSRAVGQNSLPPSLGRTKLTNSRGKQQDEL